MLARGVSLSEPPEPGPQVDDFRDPASLQVARARALAQAGYLSRAAKALSQQGLVAPSSAVVEKLRSLHPKGSGEILPVPASAPHVAVDEALLRRVISSKLKNGSAGGPSGWTGELVAPLADDEECLQGLAALVRDILNGVLDANSRSLLMASLLIPGAKDDGGVRPIAISECFYKLASMYAMALVRDSLPAIFEPIQLGVGAKGGAGRALHVLQAGLETMGPDTILLKCDIKNASGDTFSQNFTRFNRCNPSGALHIGLTRMCRSYSYSTMADIARLFCRQKGSNRVTVWAPFYSPSPCSQFTGGAYWALET